MNTGLLRIEFRRSAGLLAFPLMLAVAFAMGRAYAPMGFYVWMDTSVAIRSSVFLIGPLMGGLSAWVAVRNKRRGIQEMLSITPRPPIARDLITWAGTALWGVAAYLLFAAILLTFTYPNATWGVPLPGYILVGLFATVAASALGFVAGYYLQSRFTAPGVAVSIFLAQGIASDSQHYSLLSPTPSPVLDLTVFSEVPQVTLPQTLFLMGLTGTALMLVVLKRRRDGFLSWFTLVFFCGILAAGTLSSVEASPRIYGYGGSGISVPYEPVCKEGRITVCIHPAYEVFLSETTAKANELAEPLAGLPGFPSHALQNDGSERPKSAYPKKYRDNATLFYADGWSGDWTGSTVRNLAYELVADKQYASYVYGDEKMCESGSGKTQYFPAEEAQNIVADSLMMQTGMYSEKLRSSWCQSSVRRAKKFAALEPSERQAWLKKNLDDLRSGKLAPEDLP